MGERREEYVCPDGRRVLRLPGAPVPEEALRISPQQIADLARVETQRIPARYFVAAAERESGFAANEVDTEKNGFQSQGLYQISRGEAWALGFGDVDLLDPLLATKVFAKLQEQRLAEIVKATGGLLKEPDVWAYLGLAHNEGLGSAHTGQGALGTIARHGMGWDAYKTRNLTAALKWVAAAQQVGSAAQAALADTELKRVHRISRYGDAMISGGSRWAEVV